MTQDEVMTFSIPYVLLRYRRVPETELSRGDLVVETAEERIQSSFEGWTFSEMLKQLHRKLGAAETSVYFQRTDREGLLPYRLDDKTVELLRTDPVAAIQAMTVRMPTPAEVLDNIKKSRTPLVVPPLSAGIATLADGFGEYVYVRVKENTLECPGCGFYSAFALAGVFAQRQKDEPMRVMFTCSKKCRIRVIAMCESEWAYVRTEDLVKSSLEKFYLPRAWNTSGVWATREELEARLTQFRKDRETASC